MSHKAKDNKLIEDKIVKGNEFIAYIKQVITKGNMRRLLIKKPSGKKVIEVPLSIGVGIGGILLIVLPTLVAIASIAALLAEYKVEMVHEDDVDE